MITLETKLVQGIYCYFHSQCRGHVIHLQLDFEISSA